jgi:oxygen-independent coproporphyrinogen III oxidase
VTSPPQSSGITARKLADYDKPGPRYTSYPTAVEFSESFGEAEHARGLAAAAQRLSDPLSLYVHLPFCERRCSFCACHVVVTGSQTVADAYLTRLKREAEITAEQLGDRRLLQQYHWGGGTPTYFSPAALAELHGALLSHFELAPGAEVAIEVDPRVTTPDHLATLRDLGFNRLSLGVQDTDANVQRLIGRDQTWEQVESLYLTARRLGYESVNMDLIYGLPGQDEESFADTVDLVAKLRPDRLAVYSFALVPWMRPHQRRIDIDLLPDRDLKFALLSLAISQLGEAGYQQIGMDHFALPDDELASSFQNRTLSRNFMGYTTKRGTEIVGLGSSAISDIGNAYAQNHRRLASYYASVDAGGLPVERGVKLTSDDRVRRFVITELMCNGVVRSADLSEHFDVEMADYFAAELDELAADAGLVEAGLVHITDEGIDATHDGRLFIRNVAMVFDAYLRGQGQQPSAFSRTV